MQPKKQERLELYQTLEQNTKRQSNLAIASSIIAGCAGIALLLLAATHITDAPTKATEQTMLSAICFLACYGASISAKKYKKEIKKLHNRVQKAQKQR